ncbi:MAG: hypothetical protein HYS55_00885 [Candidatus Omnitrophica bacterium]|nr:hypothetical protein [Candidatus Omnitrophota bacterium]
MRNALPFLASFLFLLVLSIPSSYAELENFQEADVVVGQPDFTTATANFGGRSARTLSGPRQIVSDGRKLFIADRINHRILIWNQVPTTNFAPADVVLGQPDFSSATADNGGIGARTLTFPIGVSSDGKRLFIVDFGNSRVLIWNAIPTTNFAPADVVLGQPNFTSDAENNGGIGARTLDFPTKAVSDGKRLFVTDASNNRVLIWNTIPTSNFQPADVVVGQPNFTSITLNNGGRGARTLSGPGGVASDGQRLFVSDQTNNRVLIWNSIPTTNFQSADVVLGQPNFSSGTANNGGRGARTLSNPIGVATDGKRLFVVDNVNNRILIWNSIPTENFTPADIVLGQPNFTSSTANNGGRSAKTLSAPRMIASDGTRLFVVDFTNQRVLIWNIASLKLDLGPQFEQGKAVLGKVFHDINGNGVQDSPQTTDDRPQKKKKKEKDRGLSTMDYGLEKGIEGVKVVSDTGIYAITDEDGKYHFPFIETGQRVLKLDPSTLPEGARLTTESPRKIIVTEGILTKVSFGVQFPSPQTLSPEGRGKGEGGPLLKVSISQDPILLNPRLEVSSKQEKDKIIFTITCNYFLFIERAELKLYDTNYKLAKSIPLSIPLPLYYEVPLRDIVGAPLVGTHSPTQRAGTRPAPTSEHDTFILHYQLSVFDKDGHEDRTGMGQLSLSV